MSDSENSIESRQTEAALRESEEHYRAVAEATTDAIITIDSDSTILIVNPAIEAINELEEFHVAVPTESVPSAVADGSNSKRS